MTGQLIYQSQQETIAGGHSFPPVADKLPNKYSHIIFSFSDGSQLFFNDMRQFGYVELVSRDKKEVVVRTYGIEPLTPAFTFPAFRQAIGMRATALKNVLLNQAVIAGLGNIYVDEACFIAKIRPDRSAVSLTPPELKALHTACQKVIRQAIKYRGTTFNSYRDSKGRHGNFVSRLNVYGRKGKLCHRCQKSNIIKLKINGRGTTLCPNCQS